MERRREGTKQDNHLLQIGCRFRQLGQPGHQGDLTSSPPSPQGPRIHLFPIFLFCGPYAQLLSPFSISSFMPYLQRKYLDISAKCLNDAHDISQEQGNKEKAEVHRFFLKKKNFTLCIQETVYKTISSQHSTLPPESPQALLKGQEEHRQGSIKSFPFLNNVIFVNLI